MAPNRIHLPTVRVEPYEADASRERNTLHSRRTLKLVPLGNSPDLGGHRNPALGTNPVPWPTRYRACLGGASISPTGLHLHGEPFHPLMAPLRLVSYGSPLRHQRPKSFLIVYCVQYSRVASMQIIHASTVSHFPRQLNVFMRSKRPITSSRVNALSGPLFTDSKAQVPFYPQLLGSGRFVDSSAKRPPCDILG